MAGADREERVGAVRSKTIVVDAGELAAGPLLLVTVPKTELASTWGIRVPSLQLLTVRVKLVPDDALTEKLQPVAVPEFEKSPFATEFTF